LDLITKDFARRILLSAGIEDKRVEQIFNHAKELVEKVSRR
jgi:hypothetical protein